MKKLMIAALVAAMGGVTIAAEKPCGDPLTCPFVYRIKLAGKTVTGLATASNKTTCVDGKCWVKPTSLRIAGYFYGVGEGKEGTCGDISCECKEGAAYLANMVFWDATKSEVKFDSVAFDIFEILRNSGALNKAQILLKMGDLNLAGFGAFNPKTGNLKNASGFFAGKLKPAQCAGVPGLCGEPAGEPEDALVLAPCDLYDAKGDLNGIESQGSIAFGRWNLAYKADKVALANKLCVKQGYTAETVWTVPGLVTPSIWRTAKNN